MTSAEIETLFKCTNIDDLISQIESPSIKNKIDWEEFWENISGKIDIMRLIHIYYENVKWSNLSSNTNIVWDDAMIDSFSTHLDWYQLSKNESIKLNEAIIDRYIDRWEWEGTYRYDKYQGYIRFSLSNNPAFPISEYSIEKYKDYIDWRAFGLNNGLVIHKRIKNSDFSQINYQSERNLKILIRYKDRWEFDRSEAYSDEYGFFYPEKTSIFDNEEINWSIRKLRRIFYREIADHNKRYNTSI